MARSCPHRHSVIVGDRRLRGRVHRAVAERRERAVRRRRVHDVAGFALLEQHGDERVDAVDHAEHVHVDGPAPVVHVVLPQRAVRPRRDPRVVAHEVNRAEPVEGGVAQVLHRLQLRDVGGDADDVVVLRRELVDRGLQQGLVDVGQRHLHALGQEPLAQRPADPTATAGDDGDLSRRGPA